MKPVAYAIENRKKLPHEPGVYQFCNQKGTILYVGKANNLHHRVNSYFRSEEKQSIKTAVLMKQAKSIYIILVNNPHEALLLENNLIKQHQPRYNALLKDDKTFPSLCLTNERFPRLLVVRHRSPDKGTYFGPFTQLKEVEAIQALVRQLYTLRTCHYKLSEANIAQRKFKVCLEYHINHCLGPCEGKQSHADYMKEVEEVKKLLKGDFGVIKKRLTEQMQQAAKVLSFERAERKQQQLKALASYRSHTVIVHPKWGNFDVIALVDQSKVAYISYLRIDKGRIIFAQTIIMQKKMEESAQQLLTQALLHFREKSHATGKDVISSHPIEWMPEGLQLHLPQKGDKKKLLALALKNALFLQREHQNQPISSPALPILSKLQKDLHLPVLPLHIECFDNSHLQGKHMVSAMVCFKKGKAAKSGYRKFKLREAINGDDYAAMREVIQRRYQAALLGKEALPDLIIIDGGKGQLKAAQEVLEQLSIYGKVSLIAIAKKLEEIYYPNDPYPHYLDKRSCSLLLLQKIRNEAHRFVIGYYRNLHEKSSVESYLTQAVGIGPQTRKKIQTFYPSLTAVAQAPLAQLEQQIGRAKALSLKNFLATQEKPVQDS